MAKQTPAWKPAKHTKAHDMAAQALVEGTASPAQQKMFMEWLVHEACQSYDISYRSDESGGDRETAFAEGRRFVGLQIVKLLRMPISDRANIRMQTEKDT